MADIRIKVNTDELRAAMDKFNTCKAEMAAAYGQMSTEVMALNATWDGEASTAFMERFSELVVNIRTSDATIEQAVNGLKTAVDIFDNTENDVSTHGQNMTEAPSFAG